MLQTRQEKALNLVDNVFSTGFDMGWQNCTEVLESLLHGMPNKRHILQTIQEKRLQALQFAQQQRIYS